MNAKAANERECRVPLAKARVLTLHEVFPTRNNRRAECAAHSATPPLGLRPHVACWQQR